MAVSPIPPGFNSVSSYIVVPNAKEALEFYGKAFGAETVLRIPGPDGNSTMHAEMRIGNSIVMMSDEKPQWNAKSPKTLGGTPASQHLYVEDVDALFQRAVAAGCTVVMPVSPTFWGDRFAKVEDPYGHGWSMATHVEDVPESELAERARKWMAEMCGPEQK